MTRITLRRLCRDGRRRGRPDHSLHPPDPGGRLAGLHLTRDWSRPIQWLIKTPWLDAISTCSRAPGIASRRRSKARRFPLGSTASRSHPKTPLSMIVFKGDGWYGMDTEKKTLVQGHIVRLDTTRRPKAIDLHNLGPDRNPRGRPLIQGIYQLAGDTLTLCLNFGGVDRPTEFATHAGPGSSWLDVYRRDRPLDGMPGPSSGS